MSDVVDKPRKSEAELLEEVKQQQEAIKQQQQQELLHKQNDWFFTLISDSSMKTADKKLKSAEQKLQNAQDELETIEQRVSELKLELLTANPKQIEKIKSELGKLAKTSKKAEEAIRQAEQDLEKAKQSHAEAELNAEKEGFKAEIKQTDKDQKLLVAQSKFQPLYEYRLNRSKELVAELREYLPATAALVRSFEDIHADAAKLLNTKPEPWEDAYNLLPKTKDIDTARKSAEQLWNEALEKNIKAAPPVKTLVDDIQTLRDKLDQFEADMSDDELKRYRDRLDALEAPLHGSAPPPATDLMTLGLQVRTLADEIPRAQEKAFDKKQETSDKVQTVEQQLASIERLVEQGAPGYTDIDRATFSQRLNGAKTTIVLREFAQASEMLDKLLDDIAARKKAVTEELAKVEKTWDERKKRLPALDGAIGALTVRLQLDVKSGAPAGLLTQIGKLRERLDSLSSVTPGREPSFAEAIAEAIAIDAEFRTLVEATKASATFPTDRSNADQTVQKAREEADAAIAELERKLNTALAKDQPQGAPQDLAAVLQPLKQRLLEIDGLWAGRMKDAVSVAELDADAVVAEYVGVRDDAADAAGTGLERAVTDIKLAPARKSYDEVHLRALSVAQDLLAMNPTAGVMILGLLDAADKIVTATQDPQEIERQTAELKKTADEYAIAASKARESRYAFAMALEQALKPVPGDLQGFKDEINKISKGETQKAYVALLDTFTTEYETLSALRETTQVALINAALGDVEKLRAEIATARQAAIKEMSWGKTPAPSFSAAKSTLADLKERLADSDVKRYAISTAFDIGEKITALEKGFGSTTLSALTAALDKLTTEVDKVEQAAKKSKSEVEKFAKTVEAAKTPLNADPFKSSGADFADSLKRRLDGVVADATFENGLEAAKKELEKIKAEITAILDSPPNALGIPVLLFDGQERAVAAKQKNEVDKAKWEGELKVLEKNLDAAKKTAIDSREIEGLEETLRSTKESMKKSESWADGREQLDAIRKRLQLLETNPQGLIISSRNRLGPCNSFLKGEIKRFGDELTAVADKIRETDLAEDGKKTVIGELAAVRGLFNPTALDPSIPIVASKDPQLDKKKRAAAREAGLREARRMMAYIDNDFRLQALASNPFDPKMAAIVSGLKLALLDVENNLLVSMPN